jgi:hypothetical protein
MLDVYSVIAPSVFENFLDYRSAEDFRNRCIVDGFNEVALLHRRVSAEGGSLDQRKIAQQKQERKYGTTDIPSLNQGQHS